MTESALVSCQWLQHNLDSNNQVILDATYFLPRQKRNAWTEYQQHIQGALFFDIDKIADLSNPLPHTLASAENFADAVGEMGIDNNTLVVIYDNNHFFAAARVWWMFRVYGHDRVRILDGGLAHWLKLGFPTDSELPFPTRKIFNTRYHPELFFGLKQMRHTQLTAARQILDARSNDSFLGQRTLADPKLQPGHIPSSINIPYARLTDCEQQTLVSNQHIITIFTDAHVNLSHPMVASCGSGVSAAVLVLALYQIGLTEVPVYDGSWAEWGRIADTPKVVQS